jgi:LmbE family N-acetylglucosaminyl deacetylase
MENRWLLTWLLAPIFSPGGTAVEAYSLRWYRLDNRWDRDDRAVDAVMADGGHDERRWESLANSPASGIDTAAFGFAEVAYILAVTIALALLAVSAAAAQDAPKTLVAVFAHADDEGAAAPILARYAREGARVYLVIATDGAQGAAHTATPRGPELARMRAGEARCATDALNIQPPILLGFPDAELGQYAGDPARLVRLTEELEREFQRLQPDAVLTWGPDGGTGHPDHRIVSSVVTQLTRAGAPGAPERLFYVSIPAEGMRLMNPARGEPPFLVPLAKYFTVRIAFTHADAEAARAAMACHRTQYSSEVVQRVFEGQKQIWNGVITLAPFSMNTAGTDLFQSR